LRRPFLVQIFRASHEWLVAQCPSAKGTGLARFMRNEFGLSKIISVILVGESYGYVGK
jgi:hypothetical protein